VLAAANRLRRSTDIARVVRAGVRVRRGSVVVHLARGEEGSPRGSEHPRIGLAVSKAVGGSVVRHQVARRLRAIARESLSYLPADADLVIRAMPTARTARFPDLDRDVRAAIETACARAGLR